MLLFYFLFILSTYGRLKVRHATKGGDLFNTLYLFVWEGVGILFFLRFRLFFSGLPRPLARDVRVALFSSELANEVGLASTLSAGKAFWILQHLRWAFQCDWLGLRGGGCIKGSGDNGWEIWATWIPRPLVEGAYALHFFGFGLFIDWTCRVEGGSRRDWKEVRRRTVSWREGQIALLAVFGVR